MFGAQCRVVARYILQTLALNNPSIQVIAGMDANIYLIRMDYHEITILRLQLIRITPCSHHTYVDHNQLDNPLPLKIMYTNNAHL